MSTDPKSVAIVPSSVDGFVSLAKMFASSALIPGDLRAKPEDVFVTLVAGHELGLTPMASLRAIHVVKGKPILSADTMVALVLGRGAAEYFRCVEESDTSVTYETKRVGAPAAQRATWTIADAKRAGLNGDNWSKYPRAMLKARCRAVLARDVYPDVLAGCYEESERDEIERGGSRGPSPLPAVPAATPTIDATATETREPPKSTTPTDTWPAFLADVAPLTSDAMIARVGKPLAEWTELDVELIMTVALDEAATAAECEQRVAPWGAALNKHARPGSKAAAVLAGFRSAYKRRLTEVKKSGAAA